MSKLDKKIISIFLILIIFISQFSMVFAGGTKEQTLKEYLAERDIDLDNPEDCAAIKKLRLPDYVTNFEGIEKAINLENLEIEGWGTWDTPVKKISSIDFSVFKNLKELSLYNCDLSESNITELENLKNLEVDLCVNMPFEINDLKNLESLNLSRSGLLELDFTGMKCLKNLYISSNSGYYEYKPVWSGVESLTNLKNLEIEGLWITELDISNLLNLEDINISLSKVSNIIFPNSESSKLNSIYIDEFEGEIDFSKNTLIEAVSIFIDDYRNINLPSNIEKIVSKTELGYQVESKDFVIPEKINLLNGERAYFHTDFEVTSDSSNVEILKDDYFSRVDIIGKNIGTAKLLFKDDANTQHEIDVIVQENNYQRPLEETGITAEFVDNNKILKSNGELWEVNSETTAKKIDENVDKYISTEIYSYDGNKLYLELTLKDGMLEIANYSGIEEENPIANVKDIATTNYGEHTIYLTNDGDVYEIEWNYIKDKIKHNKIMTNISELDNVDAKDKYIAGYPLVLMEEGIAYSYESKNLILNHVYQISYAGTSIMIREDGTIWIFSRNNGLIKIEKSTTQDEPEDIPVVNDYIESPAIKTKFLTTNKTAITGIEPKTTVKALKEGKNFTAGYTVKVFNSKNEEVSDAANLGTGSIVRIYEGEKLVKEYIVVIYGDTNGDGLIGAVDALGIIKNKNGNVPFKDIAFVEAGRIKSGDGVTPAAIDALAIIKHVIDTTGKYTINQTK